MFSQKRKEKNVKKLNNTVVIKFKNSKCDETQKLKQFDTLKVTFPQKCRMDGQTDGQTTKRLELLGAAKNLKLSQLLVDLIL